LDRITIAGGFLADSTGSNEPSSQDVDWLRSRGWSEPESDDCISWVLRVTELRTVGYRQRAIVSCPVFAQGCSGSITWSDKPAAILVEAGWPLPSLGDRIRPRSEAYPTTYDRDAGLRLPSFLTLAPAGAIHHVPTAILPIGFAVDTLVWATIAWTLICGPRRYADLRASGAVDAPSADTPTEPPVDAQSAAC